jgi:hypothetical protein
MPALPFNEAQQRPAGRPGAAKLSIKLAGRQASRHVVQWRWSRWWGTSRSMQVRCTSLSASESISSHVRKDQGCETKTRTAIKREPYSAYFLDMNDLRCGGFVELARRHSAIALS